MIETTVTAAKDRPVLIAEVFKNGGHRPCVIKKYTLGEEILHMNQETKDVVESIMDTDTMGYAYLYPLEGGEREEYLIATTPKNLASFIGSHFYDAEKMVITDMMDRLIVNTCGGFLDHCPDQRLCAELVKHLAPIQMGEKDTGKILAVDRSQAEEYWEMEEAAVSMAEHRMG